MAIKSLDELRKLRSSFQSKIDLREKGESSVGITEVLIGMSTCGIAAGARDTFNEFLDVIESQHLLEVRVVSVGCLGYCSKEPTVQVSMPGRESLLFGNIQKEHVKELVQKVIIEKGYLEDNLLIKTYDKVGD